MNNQSKKLRAIPTNIISGFLGVGKTTTILSLLKAKPQEECWAVLVNEFGEIGVDGALLQGVNSEDKGVFIHEVPGGCMCCAAGLPMPAALNQLLIRSKPQRLLIEPSGLGHPEGVLEVLCREDYKDVLDIQKNITLVDARKLIDPRYTNHDTFKQQIDIADIVVGNKRDLYQDEEYIRLKNYVAERKGPNTQIVLTEHGNLDPMMLQGSSDRINRQLWDQYTHRQDQNANINEAPIPNQDFQCVGWRFSSEKVFSRKTISNCLSDLSVERIKAVLITDEGVISYNQEGDTSTQMELDDCKESKIEIISRQIDSHWESRIMRCLIDNDQSKT